MGVQEVKLKAIADAIRTKENSSAPIVANEFDQRILALSSIPDGTYYINLSVSNPTGGAVNGGGIASKDMNIKVSARANDGYNFEGWTENGAVVCEEKDFSFTVQRDRDLVAKICEASDPLGIEWFSATLPMYEDFIAYGNGRFVAIKGRVASYSTNGINWENTIIIPTESDIWSLVYGCGKFVGVTLTGEAAYSTDGVNWTSTKMPNPAQWNSITYGNGKFVACGTSNSAAYSTDGINWTSMTIPSNVVAYRLAYGNGKFVAMPYNTNKAAYSTDGINWTVINLPLTVICTSVACSDEKFVAVTSGTKSPFLSNKAMYSIDGINWEAVDLPFSANWRSVAHGGGKFVAVSFDSDKAVCSTDGINWVDANLPSSSNWSAVAYGEDKFVAVSTNSKEAAYSTSNRAIS